MANLKVSDQTYPKTRYTEAAAPATPAAGEVIIYAKADGSLYQKDDAGTETALANSAGVTLATDTLWDAAGDLVQGSGANTAAKLSAGTAGKVLTSNGAAAALTWETPSAGAMATDALWDAAGDLAQGTGANTGAKLSAGTAGHVLTSNGAAAAVSWQAAPGGGSTIWLQRQTASASATLDFTSFISSTYDVYHFVFTGIVVATDGALMYMRMGTGGGPTYDAGTNYSWTGWRHLAASSGTTGANSGANEIQLVIAIDTVTSALYGLNGHVTMYGPMNAVLYKPVIGQFIDHDNAAVAQTVTHMGGAYRSATAVTAVRFLASTGNITSGTIDVYGLKHA